MEGLDLISVSDKRFRIMISPEELATRISELGSQLTRDYRDKQPILLCVLKGATVFCADLMRAIETPCEMAFIKVSSYHGSTTTSGAVKRDLAIADSIKDRHVIIVEDIVDTGNTARFLFDELNRQQPASVRMATLLFKPEALQHPFKPDYTAFEIANKFVVGYGLDYNEYGRNLPGIYVLAD